MGRLELNTETTYVKHAHMRDLMQELNVDIYIHHKYYYEVITNWNRIAMGYTGIITSHSCKIDYHQIFFLSNIGYIEW